MNPAIEIWEAYRKERLKFCDDPELLKRLQIAYLHGVNGAIITVNKAAADHPDAFLHYMVDLHKGIKAALTELGEKNTVKPKIRINGEDV
jgi:hypothetical protein